MKRLSLLSLLLVGIALTSARGDEGGTPTKYSVKDYGVVGDGTTSDTKAFQKALDTCAVNGGGEVIVPAGKYLIGSVQMGQRTLLRLEKDSVIVGSANPEEYPSIDIRWEGRWQPGRRALIYAANVDHIGIIGPGRIEGNPEMAQPQNPRGSVVLEPINCDDVHWEGFSVTQGGNWATHPTYCTNVVIKNLTIKGRRDGIDVDSCKKVLIEGCNIDTGDDCVSLKSGRGMDGARLGKAVEDVSIKNCTMIGERFACIGIGSEISAGVRNVDIQHCTFTARTHAIYIKTRIGRAGVNENITADDIDIKGGSFLRINLVSSGNENTADDPVPGLIGYPTGRNFKFSNIRVKCKELADVAKISDQKPLEGLSLTNITGTCEEGISLVNVKDAELRDIHVTGFSGPLLATRNTTGTGLDGAVAYVDKPEPPKAPRKPKAGS